MFRYRLSHETKDIFSLDPINYLFWLLQDAKKNTKTCRFALFSNLHFSIFRLKVLPINDSFAVFQLHWHYKTHFPTTGTFLHFLVSPWCNIFSRRGRFTNLISQIHFKASSCCVDPWSSATRHREGHRSSPVLERKHHLLVGEVVFFSQNSYSLKLGTIISEIIATQSIQEKKGS